MNYLMLVCSDGVATPEKAAVVGAGIDPWLSATEASGARKYGHALMGAETAKTVRVRGGETLVSDGPFAESKEFVAGFDLIEADDLDAAIAIAAAHPVAQFHAMELRPLADMPGDDEFPLFRETAMLPSADRLSSVPEGKTRYMLFICVNGIAESDAEEAQIMRDAHTWLKDARDRGAQLFGTRLASPDTATTVRVRNGETLLSDGPFVEAKEFLAGIDIVDCENEQEAIELAARHPITSYHRAEVRAFAPDTP